MKKSYYLLAAMAVSVLLASCGCKCSTEPKISSKMVTKLFNEKATELCLNKQYTSFDTGYYEQNDENARLVLQKLAHAGVIDYKVERFAWFNKCTDIRYTVTKYIDYYCENTGEKVNVQKVMGNDTVIYYDLEEHYMVNVQVKSKYKSMIVDAKPVPAGDKDLAFPLYKETSEDTMQSNEAWPAMESPKVPEAPHERKDIKCAERKDVTEPAVTKKETPKKVKYPICKSIDPATEEAYKAAHELERRGTVTIFAYQVDAVKARNIQTFKKEDGTLGARCEVILKSNKVTPQAHILMGHIIDGIPAKVDIKLTYYIDKGWTIDSAENFALPAINPNDVIKEVEANAAQDAVN